ncbi:hypothetical protein L873DRAFT_1793165 [Choiromyces venosus 120613-1]|uniref:AAA ATPase AAA+ lid domain-containing protein n=1 Tax=Choiromyces venosus 120613-1 TaxID=1336337 RepID=A0A3N4JA25_9PEZI|nr:hypothetical protein L873DRAFT_1793165 [Choiromyces venosus 120613-1]
MEEVLDTFSVNNITVSLIPGGCTSLIQPLDVSINRPFKDILWDVLEEWLNIIEAEEEQQLAAGECLSGSTIGWRRVLTTWAIGEAWEQFTHERREVIVKAFRVLGISLPISGCEDHEISVKGINKTYLIEGLKDWQQGGHLVGLEEGAAEEEASEEGAEEDLMELNEEEDENDVFYEHNSIDTRFNYSSSYDFDFKKLAKTTPGFVGGDLSALAAEAGAVAMRPTYETLEIPPAATGPLEGAMAAQLGDSANMDMDQVDSPPLSVPVPVPVAPRSGSLSSIQRFLKAYPDRLTEKQLDSLYIQGPVRSYGTVN